MTQQVNQQVQEEEDTYTVGEFEEMDLSELYDKTFMVAINSGPQDKCSFICNTVCGPFDFWEMAETVGTLWEQEQLHACAFIPGSEFGKAPQVLDANTIDFIEARFMDIISDGLLDGQVLQNKDYTCVAGFIKEEQPTEEVAEDGDQ